MRFYLKWTLLLLGPFALAVGGFVWWRIKYPDRYSREDLDSSYNREQVERLQLEMQEKKRLDEAWRKQNRPGGAP